MEISAEQLNRVDKSLLRKESFIQLMKFATKKVEFSFSNIMYCQTGGVVMGSPLGPTLANILIGYTEYKIIPKFITKHLNTRYLRYVDDCFVLTTNEKEHSLLFEELNKAHKSIKECEVDNQLAFLDVLVEKRDGKFITKIYRKPTFTNNYLNFLFFCSNLRKIGLIKTLYS